MTKKCIICGEKAEYYIKNSSEYYCKECAEEQFWDINYLQKIEDNAKKLKKFLKNKESPSYDADMFVKGN